MCGYNEMGVQEEGEIDCCKQPDFELGLDLGGQSEMWVDQWMEERKSLRNRVTGILWVGESLAYTHISERVSWCASAC